MKIRTDFVTNSSSSSFVINAKQISMIEVAQMMINVLDVDDGWPSYEIISKLRYNLQHKFVNSNLGIKLPSCNYDTYIWQKDGEVKVSTCNNHDWDIEGLYGTATRVGGGSDEDWEHNELINWFFYDIETDRIITGSKLYGYTSLSASDSWTSFHMDIDTGDIISERGVKILGGTLYLDEFDIRDKECKAIVKKWEQIRSNVIDRMNIEGITVPDDIRKPAVLEVS